MAPSMHGNIHSGTSMRRLQLDDCGCARNLVGKGLERVFDASTPVAMSDKKQTMADVIRDEWWGGRPTCCDAGDDNHLLKLEEEALKVLRSKLTTDKVNMLRHALPKADIIKKAKGNRFA